MAGEAHGVPILTGLLPLIGRAVLIHGLHGKPGELETSVQHPGSAQLWSHAVQAVSCIQRRCWAHTGVGRLWEPTQVSFSASEGWGGRPWSYEATRALRAPSPCHPRCILYPENFAVTWPSLPLSPIMLQSSTLGCCVLVTWSPSSPRNQSVPKSF